MAEDAEHGKAGNAGAPRVAAEDRRDSERVPIRLMVREVALGGSFDEHPGNLSLGGVYFTERHPPYGARVEVRFVLPGTRTEVRTVGEIVRVGRDGPGFGAHVRFEGLSLEEELAIARYLEGR